MSATGAATRLLPWLGLLALAGGCRAGPAVCGSVESGGYAGAVGRVEDTTGAIAFVGVSVVAMATDDIAPGQTVLVQDGRITAVGSDGSVDLPQSAHLVDGCGRYLVPGLTDAHTHIQFPEDLLLYVANGVTTAINLGNQPEIPILALRGEVARGERLGPALLVGRLVDGRRGGGPKHPFLVYSEDEARAAAASAKAEGYDLLKVYNSLPTDFFLALMAEAKAQGIAVVGHGVREPGMEGILRAGQVMIAHAEEYLYTHFARTTDTTRIPAAVAMTVDAGAFVVPNLSTYEIIARQWGDRVVLDQLLADSGLDLMHPTWREVWAAGPYLDRQGSLADRVAFLRLFTARLHAGGVPLLLGTDSPAIPGMFAGRSIHDDLRALVAAGLSPYEALVAGTVNAGRFAALHVPGTEPFGTIQQGQRADLILVDANPLEDVANLERRSGVMVRGRWLSEARLEKLVAAQGDSLSRAGER